MSDFTSEDDVFEVEKIIASRLDRDGLRRIYRVRWKGCESDEDTWEPLENLLSCNELLKQYKEERRKKKNLKKKLNVPMDLSTQSVLSRIKEEPKDEVKTASKKDEPKIQNNVKNQAESTISSLSKRKKVDLFLNTDIDLAGFTRKQRIEMERAVEESKKLSPVLSDTEGLVISNSLTNVRPKTKKKRIRQILDDSSDDSIKSPKLCTNSITSVESAFSYSFSNIATSSSNNYVSLVDQLQKKSENSSPDKNVSPDVNQLKANEKKPTINYQHLSALKSKLGSSRNSSSPSVTNTSFSPPVQTSMFSSMSPNSYLSPLVGSSLSFPVVPNSSLSAVQSASSATFLQDSNLSSPVQHSSLGQVSIEKDSDSPRNKNLIPPTQKNALSKNKITNEIVNQETTGVTRTANSSSESQIINRSISNSPSEIANNNNALKANLLVEASARTKTSLSVETPGIPVESSGTSTLLATNPSKKSLLSEVFSKIVLDPQTRKKTVKKNNKFLESSKNGCTGLQTTHVAIATDINEINNKLVTDANETGDTVVKDVSETGDTVVTDINKINESVFNNKLDLKKKMRSECFEKNDIVQESINEKTQCKTILNNFKSNDKDKNMSETKSNFQKLGIDLSVFKPKPLVTIAKKQKDVPEEPMVSNQTVLNKSITNEAKKQSDKLKKLSYTEYQAKNRKKSSEHTDTGLFIDFYKVPSGFSEISSQPDGVDKAVIINSKAPTEKTPVIEKKKEKFVKEIDFSKIDGKEMAGSGDVLGTILETIGPLKESSKLANDHKKNDVTTENEDVVMEENVNEEFLDESDFEYDLDDYSGDEDGLLMIASLTSKKSTHETLNANTKTLDLLVIHQAIVVGDAMTVMQSKISVNEINSYVDDMDTLLMKAVMECSPDMVKIILEKSADPNTPSKNGKTPLMMAVELQQRSLVVMLIQNGAKMNIQTPSGETALILACRMGHIEIVHILLNSGADVKPAATYLEKMPVPKHLRSSLQFTLQTHSEKLKSVTENVLMDIIKFDKLPIQIDHQLMGCRCISPDETGEHDFFFECDVYVKDRHVQVVLLALPTLFERSGSVSPLFNAQNNGVKDILLNNESMVQVLPNSHYVYFLYPKHGEVNFLRVLSDITCTNKILVCVYAINFEKAVSSLPPTVSSS